jgi:APA family basic amino acid/polyamine antiporter
MDPRPAANANPNAKPHLVRGLGLAHATALNMIDMIGVGPFITISLIVSAMGGPQAMLGWILGAVFALCDGMVWAELGAAMPGSGGSYRYLNEIYGRNSLGRLVSFLFVWQISFSAPLSIASGCIGFAQYAAYLWPALENVYLARDFALAVPGLGALEAHVVFTHATLVAIGACALAVALLYRRIEAVGRLSAWLWVGVMGTIAWITLAGLTHFDASRALHFPPGAFAPSHGFFTGLGAAMLIATYDYWGYYNVCFVGGEVKDPARTIPRALLLSIVFVAAIYLVMNVSILGVVPWQELDQAAKSNARLHIASLLMQRLYGHWAGYLVTALVMWTAFSSVFSLLLGYSRVPYAAALDGNYFRAFARVHPRLHFPNVSLLALGGMAICFCFLRLVDVIAALVVIRILIQFLIQAIGLMLLRARRPEFPRPFRMWLYPAPALLAIAGFVFILVSRHNFMREIRYAIVIVVLGTILYLVRSWWRQDWPFGLRRTRLAEEMFHMEHSPDAEK